MICAAIWKQRPFLNQRKEIMSEEANEIDQEANGERLSEIAAATSGLFKAMELTDEDVAKVALTLMFHAYLHAYKGDVKKACDQLEPFVKDTIGAYREANTDQQATSLVLPPGMVQQ